MEPIEKSENKESLPQPTWHVPLPETLPQPTVWPAVLGLGSCLLAWGLASSWVISALGAAFFLLGAGGWIWRMRDEQPK